MGKHKKVDLPSRATRDDSAGRKGVVPGKTSVVRHKPQLLFQPRSDWHAAELPHIPLPDVMYSVPKPVLDKISEYGKSLLEAENTVYGATRLQSSSSYKFMATIMASGTWSDKVSALTLLVQESPLHTMKPFEQLLGLAGKRSRSQALMALSALKDMLGQGVVLPMNRKLRSFAKQPGFLAAFGKTTAWNVQDPLPKGVEKVHLIAWAYEDWLKHMYFEMLKILENWCNDEVEFSRMRAVTYVWELLRDKPEQEENLLRLLVNKLGDTNKKIASRASYLLLQLQVTHPSMKLVIINAIEAEVLLRPGQSSHAKYYAVITLNQTIMRVGDPEVAIKLLDVYFTLFIAILNKHKRAKLQGEMDAKSKKRKRPAPSTSNDTEKAEQELEDKIVAQVLTGINRAFPFSKADGVVFEKHLDTMFRITHSANFNTSIQALLLIQQISTIHHISTDRFMRTLYESLLDPRLLKSSKQTMYLNLLYRSLKADVSVRRVKAFVKRLLQIIILHEPPFISAVLYLVLELQTLFPSIRLMLEQPEAHSEDDTEIIHDVLEIQDSAAPHETYHDPEDNDKGSNPAPSTSAGPSNAYDPRKRDPEHCNAASSCLWELSPWLAHYHPSVSLFAQRLLDRLSGLAPPKPDPATHTLIHFLDRFAYRSPKLKGEGMRGTSLMQPALGSEHATDTLFMPGRSSGAVSRRESAVAEGEVVTSEAFWRRKVDAVAADDVFFHKYFSAIGPSRAAKKAANAKKKGKKGDDEDEGSEDEEEVWKALVGSRPDLDQGSDVDVDEDGDDDEVDMDDDDDGEDEEGGVGLDEDISVDEDDMAAFDEDEADGGSEVELNLESDDDETAFTGKEIGMLPASAEQAATAKGRRKKRKLSSLPTFASIEDYAKLLDADDESADEGA